jgi:Wiskott-Aldrich syndrome protein
VKLAMKYLKRVSSELEAIEGGPEEEELMLQGVRFAFRVHQVHACLVVVRTTLQYPFFEKNSYIQVYIIRAALKHSTLLGPCFVQFAGGFDVDTMRAFQELKEKASMCRMQRQNQNRHLRQHRLVART